MISILTQSLLLSNQASQQPKVDTPVKVYPKAPRSIWGPLGEGLGFGG